MALYTERIRVYCKKHALTFLIVTVAYLLNPNFIACQDKPSLSHHTLESKARLFKHRVEYDSAIYYYEKLDHYLQQEGEEYNLWNNRINIADVLILQRNYPRAKDILDETWLQAKRKGSVPAEFQADFYQVRGSYYMGTNFPDSAEYLLKTSINIRLAGSGLNDTLLHYAFNKLGNLYIVKSVYDSALFYHKKALEISLKKRDSVNFLTASSYQNLGIAAQLIGDYQLAEECYTKSLELKEMLFSSNDPALAKIYWNMGKFYSDLSKYNLAIDFYNKSEQLLLLKYKRDDYQFAHVYWNKGNVYTHKGDFVKSTSYLSKAQAILEAEHGPYNQNVLRVLQDLGFAYDKKGDKQIAIDFYTRAARNSDYAGIIKIFRNLGNIYMELNQADSADKYYHLSLSTAQNVFSGISYDLALCYQYYGEFLAKSKHDPKALWYYNRSAEIFKQLFGEKNKDLSKVYRLQSEYYLSASDYYAALEWIQASLIALLPGFSDADPYVNPDQSDFVLDIYLQDALKQKALTYYYLSTRENQDKYLESCIGICDLAVELTEEIRKTFNEEESQLVLNKQTRDIIDLGVMASLDIYKISGEEEYLHKAFDYSEKGQSIILLSALRGLEAQYNQKIPLNLQTKERNIAEALALYNNLLFQERQKKIPDKAKTQLWTDRIFNLRLKHDSILSAYKNEYPDYFKLKFDYTNISVDSAMVMLENDQALIEYFLTDSLVYGFVLTNDVVHAQLLGQKGLLKNKLDSLRLNFVKTDYFNSGTQELEQITRFSADLYDMLIRPFENRIKGKRLIIIPDGELGYLSFDMLLAERPAQKPESYHNLNWLINDYPLSYSSSATIFFEQLNLRSKKVRKNLLAFAPSYEFIRNRRDAGPSDSILMHLSPMVGTKEEVSAIAELFSAKIRFDSKATETYFKDHAGEYNILHLAMHTIVDDQNPLYSKLIFTPDPADSTNDGFLNTYELFNLSLPGQLAVLSACNTGSGKLERGEGILSLARGFFYAGIPNVVMTLWEIEDHSSADLMALFYENLKKGQPSDIAMQKAKITYLENANKLLSHPYFWAGYVNIGKPGAVNASIGENRMYYVFGGIFILVLMAFAYFFINRRVFLVKKRH